MVDAVKNEGKTAFVKDVLTKNHQANPQIVNEEWTAAGHAGSISATLVQKVRSQMGLTGNLRMGRKPAAEGSRPPARATTAPRSRGGRPKNTDGRSLVKVNGTHDSPVRQTKPKAGEADRTRVLTSLEGDIDEMIFAVKGVGGLHDFEETLRKARRILSRSHGE